MLAPWKKSYGQPRQHIKKQRHYFADKGLPSQSYGFSSSHVWIQELAIQPSHLFWPFSVCPLSFPASVLPMNIQGWFPLGLTGLISLQSKGLKSLLQHHSSKASILRCSVFFTVQLSHPYTTTGKTIALTRRTFVGKKKYLCFLICCLGWS